MLRRQITIGLGAALLATPVAATAATSATEFYNGKTITYIVATKPGGTYDTLARLIGRYIEKHLQGTTVLVKNVPGAGNIIGANTIYAAKPDGLTIGSFNTGLIYTQLAQQDAIKFDLAKMSWIGKAASDSRSLILGSNSGFTNFGEFAAAQKPVKVAVAGVGTASYIDMRLLNRALNVNFEILHGYEGTEAEMSIRRGEVHGTFGSASSLAEFVKNGYGFNALDVGGKPGSPVPQARDLAKDDRARALIAVVEAQALIGRLTAGPPGIPEQRLKTLRETYLKVLNDPDFLADARKLNIPIDPAAGEEVESLVKNALQQSPETVELLRAAMKEQK